MKELWNISEKDWLNLSNRQFLLAFFTQKKHPEDASIHRRKESFPVKPFLTIFGTFGSFLACLGRNWVKSHCYSIRSNLKKWTLSSFAFQSFQRFIGTLNKKNFSIRVRDFWDNSIYSISLYSFRVNYSIFEFGNSKFIVHKTKGHST